MSFLGIGNIYIAKNATHQWNSTWPDPEWPGNVIYQPQTASSVGSLTYTIPSISMGPNGNYTFSFDIVNNSVSTIYGIQVSTS